MKNKDFQKVETRSDSTAMTNDSWIGRETTKRKVSTKRTYSKAENGISQNIKVTEADL